MGRNVDQPERSTDAELSLFGKKIEEALKQIAKATKSKKEQPNVARWLGEHSPLATPYLLHEHLTPEMVVDAESRGRVLQELLRRASQTIQDDRRDLYQTIIARHFFQAKGIASIAEVNPEYSYSHTQLYEHRRNAIEALGAALIRLLNPALRLETPPSVPQKLWGRSRDLVARKQMLTEGKTVSIIGAGGIGKTTLGAAIAHEWHQGPVFWFTVRPGLNDQPNSLLFALAYFLNRCGEPVLWRELLAQSGRYLPGNTPLIIREALEGIIERQQMPLFCFDEVDLLDPAHNGAHGQIMNLIDDSLRALAPVLLIGHQAVIGATYDHPLDALSTDDTDAMVRLAGVTLSPDERQMVHAYTQGNPRLIDLCIAFCRYGDTVSTLQESLIHAQPVEYLLGRILQRLSDAELGIVLSLTVYRAPAPAEVWQDIAKGHALNLLMQRKLVQADERGGLTMSPIYRQVIYQTLPADSRLALHWQAAIVYQARGFFTEAAYHLLWAGRAGDSILDWDRHKQEEINQGQAPAALQIFRKIEEMPVDLRPILRRKLELLCAELEVLQGNAVQALTDLRFVLQSKSVLAVDAYTLAGRIENDRSNFTQAEAAFNQALAKAADLVGVRMAHIYKGLAWMHMRARADAWGDACRARFEAENIQGFVKEIACAYAEAEQYYLSALRLAEEVDYIEGIAKTCNNLAGVYARRGEFDSARRFMNRAEECTQQIGKLPDLPGVKVSWAFLFNLAGEHEAARNALLEALDLFPQLKLKLEPWPDALIHQGLAEAYLGLGDLEQAESCTRYAIGLEEGDVLPDAFRTLGEIMLARGAYADAEHWIQASLHLIQAQDEPDRYLNPYAWRALARVYLASGDLARAKDAIDRTIDGFLDINLSNEVKRTYEIICC